MGTGAHHDFGRSNDASVVTVVPQGEGGVGAGWCLRALRFTKLPTLDEEGLGAEVSVQAAVSPADDTWMPMSSLVVSMFSSGPPARILPLTTAVEPVCVEGKLKSSRISASWALA